MRRTAVIAAALTTIAGGCRCDHEPPRPPPPQAKAPIRGAAADSDLRLMLAEIASAKACDVVKGQFRPLRAPDQPGTATGVLWIRDCRITHDGTRVSFRFSGNGWQWAQQEKHEAGATFGLAQQVRFAVDVQIPGAIDLGYDRASHVVSVWFTPSQIPSPAFKPIGDFDVERESAWASVLGALSSAFASSPEEQAASEADRQGTYEFQKQLADGLAVTIDLCTGLSRFNLGRPAKGAMQPPDVGEAHRVPFELQPSGLMVLGPYLAPKGMTADFDVQPGGKLQVMMMCQAEAERMAAAYVEQGHEILDARTLAVADVEGKQTVHAGAASCPVDVVARTTGGTARFTWTRPARESARSTGGPVIDCSHDRTAARDTVGR